MKGLEDEGDGGRVLAANCAAIRARVLQGLGIQGLLR